MKPTAQYLFEVFKNQKVLIIGDVMIDSYIWGKVDRISPEAPVPIVSVDHTEKRLGGAANVALNIQALGAEALLCAVIGKDSESESFMQLMQSNQLSTQGIISSESRITTIKHRIISQSQHILRIDQEHSHNILDDETELLWRKIQQIIASEKVNVVIFEDYDKGVITPQLIQNVVNFCNNKGIPTVVDPKKRNFMCYENVTLFKPNLKELKEGLKIEFNAKDKSEVENATQKLRELLHIDRVFVTLSELGVMMCSEAKLTHVKAHKREIADVSGAGDTVVSVAALCLGAKFSDELTAELSNLAGGIVCEKVGVVPININELLEEATRTEII